MTLMLRTAQLLGASLFKEKLPSLDHELVHQFRVLPTDIDIYRHMNNSKYLNYMEAARWAYANQIGLLRISAQKGWITPISRIAIQYKRPLHLFEQFELKTRLVHLEEKWIYFFQEFTRNKSAVAQALVKATVRSQKRNIPPAEYLAATGYPMPKRIKDEKIRSWLQEFSIGE